MSTPLEILSKRAEDGEASIDELVRAFLESVVVLPSATDPTKEQIQPVYVEVDGVTHELVCDSLATVASSTNLARYAASMTGADIVQGTSPDVAILMRTATGGFSLDVALLNEIRARREGGNLE